MARVKERTRVITVTPTIDTNAYTSGDQLGDLMEFDFSYTFEGGKVVSVEIIDDIGQAANMELWLFNNTVQLAADNAAASLGNADLAKLLGVVSITTHYALAANSASQAKDINIALETGNAPGIIYGALVVRATPTYTGTDNLHVKLGVSVD